MKDNDERPDWMTVRNTERGHRFECARCGAAHEPVLPMLLETFIKSMRAFEALHEDCPPPPRPLPK